MNTRIACSAGPNATLTFYKLMPSPTEPSLGVASVSQGLSTAQPLDAHTRTAASLDDFISRIKHQDEAVFGPAWQEAPKFGAAAVKPLADLMADTDFELARRAKRALNRIVRHVGRPGANEQAETVEKEVIPLLKTCPVQVRRDLVWMLSEIASTRSLAAFSTLLDDPDLREDARCAITRHPSQQATAFLRSALDNAPEEFRYALADSLRARGQKVDRYPTRKLTPSRKYNP